MRPFGSSVVLAVVVASAFAAPACTCGSKSAMGIDGGAVSIVRDGGLSAASLAPSAGAGRLRLSAPIAAATTRGGATFVAGLDAARGVLVVARLRADDGDPAWTRDALPGVKWSPGVSLHVQAAGDGVAVLWRGPRAGASVKQAVMLDAEGNPRGGVVDVGALACATDAGLAWIEAAAKGGPRVRMQAAEGAPFEIAALAADREPELLCAPNHVFVSARGDDDVTLLVAAGDGKAVARKVTLSRASDFPRDEEREHATYVAGDDFGIVRLGETGGLSLREVREVRLAAASPTPWKKLAAKLTPDDDLVALDADERAVALVYTRDAGEACAGPLHGATSVHALLIDRASLKVSSFDLAPGECGKEVGPFSIGRAAGALVPLWAERAARPDKAEARVTAPIVGFAFRRIGVAGLSPLERRAQPADAIADAGCDLRGCRVVALVREPGSDGMVPEAIRAFAYR